MDKTKQSETGNPYSHVNVILDLWQIKEMKKRGLNRSGYIRMLIDKDLGRATSGRPAEGVL